MKNIIFATFIAILFALSFVSCDKDDEPWTFRDRFYVDNQSSYSLAFDGYFRKIIPHDYETEYGLEELNIASEVWVISVPIKWGSLDDNSSVKDSILELKNYALYPTRHEIVKNDTIHMEYRDHHYVFTDSVLRDMKDSMRVKGILPQKVEE
jgi:hypothetical protein